MEYLILQGWKDSDHLIKFVYSQLASYLSLIHKPDKKFIISMITNDTRKIMSGLNMITTLYLIPKLMGYSG